MRLAGTCHCGNVTFTFETAGSASEIEVRACACSFCRQHAAETVTDASGHVTFHVEDAIRRHRFGANTADFLVCPRCGAYAGAVATFPEGPRATVNVRLSSERHLLPEASAVSYDGERAEERLARRRARWTPATLPIAPARSGEGAAPRIAPLEPPFSAEAERLFAEMMPTEGPPLAVFRLLARSPELARAMTPWGTYIMRKRADSDSDTSLSMRDRELLILRVGARCKCEYEWGAHATYFAEQVGLTPEQVLATLSSPASDAAWGERDRLLVRLVDEVHDHSRVSDALWKELETRWPLPQLLEALMVIGWYHAIAFFASAVHLPAEDGAARFPRCRSGP